jgi:ElaB/YqjD/DUF883 family membrane-anchored ribosome-binding protein
MMIGDKTPQRTAVEGMTTEEQISKNQDERDEARQNFRDTLTELNAKVERTGNDLRPEHLVESHPVAASLIAGALGFLIGANINNRGTGPIMIAAVLGFALSIRSSRETSECDGREIHSSE